MSVPPAAEIRRLISASERSANTRVAAISVLPPPPPHAASQTNRPSLLMESSPRFHLATDAPPANSAKRVAQGEESWLGVHGIWIRRGPPTCVVARALQSRPA